MIEPDKTPPVVPPSNAVLTARGHDEKKLGRKLTYCAKCKAKKPARGGWQTVCPADARRLMGE